MPNADDDPYAAIAEWYDVEHDLVTEDVECYQELMRAAAGPHAHVLEIGSGSGRVVAALSLAGHSVTGVEPSAAMRARAARRLAALPERAARRARQIAGTAVKPGLDPSERFDAILLGCNTFAHLLSDVERRAALAALRSHLRPSGVLVLDLDVAGPRNMADTMGLLWLSGTWTVPGRNGETLAHFSAAHPGPEPDVLVISHFYDVWSPDQAVRRTASQMPLAVLDPQEVEQRLLDTGYRLRERYGSYDLTQWDDEAPRAIFVADA